MKDFVKITFSAMVLSSFLFGCKKDNPPIPEDDSKINKEITYQLPHLRFWDTREQVIAFEEGNGNQLIQEDPQLSFLKFSNKNKNVESVGYVLGQAIQMFMKKEALGSPEFKEFLSKNGFIPEGKVQKSIQKYKSEKWSTVKAFSVLEDIDFGDGQILPSGMCFTAKNPELKTIPYPILDWSITPKALAEKEASMGYTFLSKNELKSGKTLYTYVKKEEKKEFTELFSHRYIFDGDSLILSSLLISPDAYVMNGMGDGFFVTTEFDTLLQQEGFTTKQITVDNDGKETTMTIYLQDEKKMKFSLNKWKINLNGFSGVRAASLDFVPFDGPDIIDYEL